MARTVAGQLLVSLALRGDVLPSVVADAVRDIEEESRKGYVPESLSPEWSAELRYAADEARTDLLDRLAAGVEARRGYFDDGLFVRDRHGEYLSFVAVLALIEEARK